MVLAQLPALAVAVGVGICMVLAYTVLLVGEVNREDEPIPLELSSLARVCIQCL